MEQSWIKMVTFQKVESGLIARIGYLPEAQTLYVEFHKSKKQTENPVYSYTPFSPERWKEFSAQIPTAQHPGGSVGKYFLANIKTDATLTVAKVQQEPGETSTTEWSPAEPA